MSVRVLIVDDSPFVREILRDTLARYPDIEVVGEAADGKRAEQLVMELRPDVVTMDMVMPLVGGMEAIRSIMARCPTPIVVVSDAQSDIRRVAMRAIEAGAIDAFCKPSAGFDARAADRLASLVRSAARVRVGRRWEHGRPPRQRARAIEQRIARAELIGIVASTGGPQTLRRIIGRLSSRTSVPIAVVQHTSIGFTRALVSWLSSATRLRVSIASDREPVTGGQIVVAPDDAHLEIDPSGAARVHQGPRVHNHRPSGTLLLRSLASSFGASAVGVVLTGMGDDGAEGVCELEARGGLVLIENPRTAILDGMPRAAVQRAQDPVIASAERLGELLRGAFTTRSRG